MSAPKPFKSENGLALKRFATSTFRGMKSTPKTQKPNPAGKARLVRSGSNINIMSIIEDPKIKLTMNAQEIQRHLSSILLKQIQRSKIFPKDF